jgi:hypothetical protein
LNKEFKYKAESLFESPYPYHLGGGKQARRPLSLRQLQERLGEGLWTEFVSFATEVAVDRLDGRT